MLAPIKSAYVTSRMSVIVTLVLSCTISEIDSFYVLLTAPLFHPNFGGVPVAPDHPCWGQCEHRPYAIRPWNYFSSIPTYVKNILQCHRQTDDLLWHNHTPHSIAWLKSNTNLHVIINDCLCTILFPCTLYIFIDGSIVSEMYQLADYITLGPDRRLIQRSWCRLDPVMNLTISSTSPEISNKHTTN